MPKIVVRMNCVLDHGSAERQLNLYTYVVEQAHEEAVKHDDMLATALRESGIEEEVGTRWRPCPGADCDLRGADLKLSNLADANLSKAKLGLSC